MTTTSYTKSSTVVKLISSANYYTWKDNIIDCLQGQNLWQVTSGKEIAPAPAAIVGSATAVTEAATFNAQCHTASYTQCIDAALSMINLSLDCPL
jgi:hypothetical protein